MNTANSEDIGALFAFERILIAFMSIDFIYISHSGLTGLPMKKHGI